MSTLFKSLAELLEKVEATRSRLQINALAADFLKIIAPEEVELAVSLMLGRAFPKWRQKTLEVSWMTLSRILQRETGVNWDVFAQTYSQTGDIGSATKAIYKSAKLRRQAFLFEKPLTILDVGRTFELIADAEGSGSREKKNRLIAALLSQASALEAKYFVKIFTGEMRTGFYEGLMEQAVAKAFGVPIALVRRASMALGDIGEVAFIARTSGVDGLEKVRFTLFRPVLLMLAQAANSVESAFKEHGGETAFEYKYDGARIQIHKLGSKVQVFSRRLNDATESLPEVVDAIITGVKADAAILEGEVVAVDSVGVPIPFQHLMRRFKRVHKISSEAEKIPLKLYLFDILYINGRNLISLSYVQRRQILAETVAGIPLTSQRVTADAAEAEAFLKAALAAGHEGLMAKKLESPYLPGARGKLWLKIKPILESLDLVITAAEWGSGRRHGWLSNYYLAARDSDTGKYFELGKTFKGLTDTEIVEMTKRLQAIAVSEEGHRVVVLPKILVEVAFNEIQKSSRYQSQMALRFARIIRIRDDKPVEEADTIQRVKAMYEGQFAKKGRYKNE